MRATIPQRLARHSSLAALVLAMACATAVVHRFAPWGMLWTADRPFAGHGNPRVRTGQASYPRLAVGADNERVTVSAKPTRIVSQAWAADEFLYTVVPPELIVGGRRVAASWVEDASGSGLPEAVLAP